MRIPTDVILLWPGLNSAIPSGWSRETSLDGKFPKGWGAEAVNTTGGADTHAHSVSAHSHNLATHTHTYTLPSATGGSDENRTAGATSPQPITFQHTHAGTTGNNTASATSSDGFTTGTGDSRPPFYDLIFVKASLGAILQNDMIGLWAGYNAVVTIPTNWQECNGGGGSPDLRNKYIHGAGAGANAGATGGATTHSHNLTHGHTGSSHNHGSTTSSSTGNYNNIARKGTAWNMLTSAHQHTFTPGSASVSVDNFTSTVAMAETVEPLYKKVCAIQKKTGGIKPKGLIGLWLGSEGSIPKGWALCDGNNGTPNLKDYFVKIANDTSEIGNTGGSNTHNHANYSHQHTSPAHNHSIASIDHYEGNLTNREDANSANNLDSLRIDQHVTHAATNTDNASPNWSAADMVFNSVSNQPAYRTAIYVQFQKDSYGGGAMLGLL